MKEILSRRRTLVVTALAAALMVAGLGGCGQKQPASRLRLRSAQSGKLFSQKFPQAYYSMSSTGEHEIVLVDDGDGARAAKPGRPLQPSASGPLRQVVHIRVHWRPLRGTKPDHPSATNAVIDWYVTAPGGDSDERLHYRGAAFVEMSPKNGVAKIVVSNGSVELVESTGALRDPVGRSSVSGTFVARRSDARVAAAVAPMRSDDVSARAVRPAGSRQPPRREPAPGGQ